MNICDMIPGLGSGAIETVRMNATRLYASGTPKQKEQGRDALVLIGEEEIRRRAVRPAVPPKAHEKTGIKSPAKALGKGWTSNVAA
ncbi:hypothetical protein [Prosthecomicrobium sp. N25]|uniref:hypothetical protein n=1 Tax=Prosthecomicrobium sp. N25 TaxID=3129254 RepID=UPI0030789DB9